VSGSTAHTVVTRMVRFPTASGEGQGMLATPPVPGPGVLLLPDFRGLAPDTVATAARLARAGLPTLAVDLFQRVTSRFGDFYEQQPAAMLSLDRGTLADEINGAVAFLLGHPLVGGAGVCAFGHDAGGSLALWAAVTCPSVVAVSAAYPARQLWRAEGINLQGFTASRVLLHLADDATSFRPADAQRVRQELERAGADVEIFTYPGTRHGFLADIRPDLFDEAAAALVWERTRTLANWRWHRPRTARGPNRWPGTSR
jgi:carboxymethylenebutenolidase